MEHDEIAKQVEQLSKEFAACSKILTAIGDETRQHLILEMLRIGECNGIRVGEITQRTNLSRPAVSHHLQIMKDAGLIRVRKEGTRHFYYFDSNMEMLERLSDTLKKAVEITKALPDRSGEDD